MKLLRLENAQVTGHRVLLRIDSKYLLDRSGAVSNPNPLFAIKATIDLLLQRGASILFLTHSSNPKTNKAVSLEKAREFYE